MWFYVMELFLGIKDNSFKYYWMPCEKSHTSGNPRLLIDLKTNKTHKN